MTESSKGMAGSEAVSESVGFLLIFMIVITGIGMVTLYGYPMLLSQQVSTDQKIMEKNMIVLQNDVKGITFKTVPYKETSLTINGGLLTVYNTSSTPATSTFRIYDAGRDYLTSFTPGDLRYTSESSGTDISLQNGAVVLRSHNVPGSSMLAEPRWFYDGQANTMVINLISINSTGVMSRSGLGTVQMAKGETGYQYTEGIMTPLYLDFTPDPTPVVGQDYRIAWDNYFINTLGMERTTSIDDPTVTYKLPTTTTSPARLVVKTYDIIIRSI